MVRVSIVIPVYNEETAVRETIDRIKKLAIPDSEIIAINDGSSDNSGKTLDTIKDIRVIHQPYNLGYGASLKKALREARGEWVCITDADGTYPIADIPKLLEYVPQYDMVVGARTGSNVHIPLARKPAKWMLGKLANILSGRKIDDINSGMRVFNREKALEFMKLYPAGFSFTTTITLSFLTNDYSVKYIPINYFKRKGTSHMRPKEFFRFIALMFRITLHFRPLKFFLIPGALLVLAGLAYGTIQGILSPTGLGEFPILLVILGALVLMFGALADITARK